MVFDRSLVVELAGSGQSKIWANGGGGGGWRGCVFDPPALKNMFLALCTISKNPDLPRAQLSALYTKILAAKGHAHSQGSGRENFSRLARHLEQPGKHREEIL